MQILASPEDCHLAVQNLYGTPPCCNKDCNSSKQESVIFEMTKGGLELFH